MLRLCGASVERDALSQKRCWCGGLFCGKGGARQTARFRRAFHTRATAASRAELEDLIRQADLFDGVAVRDEWMRLIESRPLPAKRRTA